MGEDTLHMPPCTAGGHTIPWYMSQPVSLGGPSVPTSRLMSRSLRCDELRCRMRDHQAQNGN